MNLRSTTRGGLAAAALLTLPLTTACQTRIGEAATVGDQHISTSTLTAVTGRSSAALAANGNAVPAGQAAALQRSVLNLLLRDALLGQIGKAQGVSVSQAEVNTERAAEAQQAGGDRALVSQSEQGGVSAADLPLVIRERLLITKLQTKLGVTDSNALSKALTGAAQRVPVRINPRFGTWDPKTLSVVGSSGDLSSTVTKT